MGNPSSNCAFLTSIVDTIVKKGKTPGIYSSFYMWSSIFGTQSGCSKLTKYKLWYAYYNEKASLDDYSDLSFGGWDSAYLKQYSGDRTLCGASIDKNYRL